MTLKELTMNGSNPNLVLWLLAIGLVAGSVSLLEQVSPKTAWYLVFLVILSALVLDRQRALAGLTAALSAASG